MKVLIVNDGYFPKVLKFTDVRSYLYITIFIALSVAVPWSLHQFPLAGATFLPMHFFVIVAGLVFGWRAGLIVGLFSPLISYGISGMPVILVLPQIAIELSVYGLVAGILREKFSLGLLWSLLGAMVAGRLALLAFILIKSYFGTIYSPLGAVDNAYSAAWETVSQSWPGIAIQLAGIPFIAAYLQKRLH